MFVPPDGSDKRLLNRPTPCAEDTASPAFVLRADRYEQNETIPLRSDGEDTARFSAECQSIGEELTKPRIQTRCSRIIHSFLFTGRSHESAKRARTFDALPSRRNREAKQIASCGNRVQTTNDARNPSVRGTRAYS